jgi:hypothetical protein
MEYLRFKFLHLRKNGGIILPIWYRYLSLYIMKFDTGSLMTESLDQLSSPNLYTHQIVCKFSLHRQHKSDGIGLTTLTTKKNEKN